MSISHLCQVYQSSTSSGKWFNWKKSLYDISTALEAGNHPDHEIFQNAACMLTMCDKPGYWQWMDTTISKLIYDPRSRLDPLPVLIDYEELSTQDLLEKYEIKDKCYSRHEILYELRQRYPLLIQSNVVESNLNLREKLKDVI